MNHPTLQPDAPVTYDMDPDLPLDLRPYLGRSGFKLGTAENVRREQARIYRLMRNGYIAPTRGLRLMTALSMILRTIQVRHDTEQPVTAETADTVGLPDADAVLARIAAAVAQADGAPPGQNGPVLPTLGGDEPQGPMASMAAGESARGTAGP